MGKIYQISGSFMQNGKWADPNPSFIGWAYGGLFEEDVFYGFCEKLYDKSILKGILQEYLRSMVEMARKVLHFMNYQTTQAKTLYYMSFQT